MNTATTPVIFAGAGPGDPELITVKAMNALKSADLIVYAGSLVPEAVLCWKGSHTKAVSSADMDLEQIIEAMETAYGKGERVVRLHTGDPALYGAIFEQMRELDARRIPYSVIPGVTAAFAASAQMKIEYTLPELSQTLILTRVAGRTPVPESENFESLCAHQTSMAIYLSIGQINEVQKTLEKHYGADSSCAIAYKVSHPEEKIVFTPIKELAETCKKNNILRHALIVVGKSIETVLKNTSFNASQLYNASFSHGYRKGK